MENKSLGKQNPFRIFLLYIYNTIINYYYRMRRLYVSITAAYTAITHYLYNSRIYSYLYK